MDTFVAGVVVGLEVLAVALILLSVSVVDCDLGADVFAPASVTVLMVLDLMFLFLVPRRAPQVLW